MTKAITKEDINDLKKWIRFQEVLTRRTVVKNSRKHEYNTIKRKLKMLEATIRKEKNLRKKYPAVQEAYDHYLLTLGLVKKSKGEK
tara:strand:+ start:9603 stop:9860 length:258 start_codon:yes stop_codon:yes gene_type:complete